MTGAEDVSIADLIKKLGHSDWVNRGVVHLEQSHPNCPFCQQPTPDRLQQELADFFDDSFKADCQKIKDCENAYRQNADAWKSHISRVLSDPPFNWDINEGPEVLGTAIGAKLDANLTELQRKVESPGLQITLTPVGEDLQRWREAVVSYNEEADEKNALIADHDQQRARLRDEVWRYVLNVELTGVLQTYLNRRQDLTKAIESLREQIDRIDRAIVEAGNELNDLRAKTTTSRTTMDRINTMLVSSGFDTFKLDIADETTGRYRLVRPDGSSADETLSDGERSFITFVYFVYRATEAAPEEVADSAGTEASIAGPRVLVVDDPVSSMDGDNLFIISSLVRSLVQRVRDTNDDIRQIFVLTHNVYFHKEVAYDTNRPKNLCHGFEQFWLVRRPGGYSSIEAQDCNPVLTTYEQLWQQVRDPDSSAATLRNVMRRILEHYFKLLGEIGFDDLTSEFDPEDQMTCRALISWTQDGSHGHWDDYHLSPSPDDADRYRRVFKRIFDLRGHAAHYEMMTRTN